MPDRQSTWAVKHEARQAAVADLKADLTAEIAQVAAERDAALGEVERLRAALERTVSNLEGELRRVGVVSGIVATVIIQDAQAALASERRT